MSMDEDLRFLGVCHCASCYSFNEYYECIGPWKLREQLPL